MKNHFLKGLIFGVLLIVFSCKNETPVVEEKSNSDSALESLSSAILKDTLNHKLLFERASYLYKQENYDGAIEDLIKAINLDSLQHQYYHTLTDVCLDYFRSKEAVLTMEQCVKVFPKRIGSLLKLSEVYYILRQYDESLGICNKILNIDKQEPEAYFMMGMNFRDQKDIGRAINSFQTATELNPELTDAWIILGQLFEEKQNPIALEYFNAAVNVDPTNISALHSKAFYLQNNDMPSEAISIYRTIGTIDKNYLDAYLNSGILYMNLDSLSQAYEQFNIITSIAPQNHIGFYYRGQVLEKQGKIAQAKSDYQTSVNLNSENIRAKKALEDLSKNPN